MKKLTRMGDLGTDLEKLYGDHACFKYKTEQTVRMFLNNGCVKPKNASAKNILLMGDSFSASLAIGLGPVVEKQNKNLLQVSTGWCEPTSDDESDAVCKDINAMVLKKSVRSNPKPSF